MRRILGSATIAWLLLAAVGIAAEPASAPDARGAEFFEKRIRPLLAENCYQCHGVKKQESGLVLSTAAAIQSGGDRGQLFAPGEPDASLIIQAVRYTDDDLKMPPRGKLKEEQIADLVTWIRLGAPVPRDNDVEMATVRPSSDFDPAERRKHWAYQSVQPAAPPSVSDAAWNHSPIDAFILSELDAAGLSPAPPAQKRTLVRRATFDLLGLPPTPGEVAAFLAEQAPDAFERLVDRLLASPRYGERFGRHWLDVVRYSETLGFEFDYDLHNAWRYRDYVIRAFNADLPYDQFVIEHLAGDLVPQQRRHALDGTNESILATGFFWMYEGKQTPVDIRQYQADCIDNQLDVLGKAFLGQTIACARCHDHKFDAIATRDYYALAGYLRSSRYQQAFIDPPELLKPKIEQLADTREKIQSAVAAEATEIWSKQSSNIGKYLLAAAKVERGAGSTEEREKKIAEIARQDGLDESRLNLWAKALSDESLGSFDHPLYAWAQRVKQDAKTAAELRVVLDRQEAEARRLAAVTQTFEDFRGTDYDDWIATGTSFATGPAQSGGSVIGSSAARPISRLTPGGADSGALSTRLQGELRSQSFTIDKKFVHLRLAGRSARVNLVIDGYTLIMNPMYGKLTAAPSSDRLVWRTMPVDRWIGHRAFIEVSDSSIPMHGLNPPPSPARVNHGPDGYIAIDQILFSDDATPPVEPNGLNIVALQQAETDDLVSLASAYERVVAAAIERWRMTERLQERGDDIALLNWLLENGLLDAPAPAAEQPVTQGSLTALIERFQKLEADLPVPQRAPTIADGTGEDEFVFLRGNYRTPGERAARGLPQVLCQPVDGRARLLPSPTALSVGLAGASSSYAGSGRLELAQQLVDPSNPLLPRVFVNRLWQHHFGEGIVRTPDDFGRMGQPPSHPELLDYLATELNRGDWSIKNITRRMVTSTMYRQSSAISDSGLSILDSNSNNVDRNNLKSKIQNPKLIDPDNRLLHRMPIRRLEAEAIRDSTLALAGRLNFQMHGPSVLPFLTAHMEGRGKPQSGSLDGEGRRSVYINARRNFLTPLLLTFDYPVTFTPIGRRGAATIPTQALTLMNDPFVVQEATRWAARTLEESGSSAEQRIEALYQTAFARPPTADEVANAIDFLQEQSLRHGTGSDDPKVWTDLCHVLINVKEFIFID